ncbi:hypothetical protein [Microbacterium sulfonylureivorans]|uniref:hypothetical protein n=1 Tax=Microbacterium sulfonylureivorans TaxID=2486854 RepID=UPI0013E0A8A9|nr:hypothetical protein [Microbacterium sulfonylureivorans]
MTYGYGYNGGLTSPNRHFVLQELDGNPDDIEAAGLHYSAIGEQMDWTADELKKLADDTKYKADSLDKVRESAGELHGELRKAAVRYVQTGPVLVTYAGALRTARNVAVDPYVERIRSAHEAAETAGESLDDAQGKVDDLDTTWIWEDDPTDEDRAAAASALSDARRAANSANSTLTSLWESFESGYGAWEEAYDAAVEGVGDAIDASGVNDSWWEDLLDGIADAMTVIGAIAIVLAIVIGGPIFLVIATIAAVVTLAAHLTMMAAGSKRVSWGDIVIDLIAVAPFLGSFAKGAMAGRGVMASLRVASGMGGATSATLRTGRNAVALDLRSITGAGRNVGNRAARELRAPGLADDFLRGVEGAWGRNALNALRTGGDRWGGMAQTMSSRMASEWPGAGRASHRALNWMAQNGMPGAVAQGVNVWNFANGNYQVVQLAVDIPGATDVVDAVVELSTGDR